MQNYGMIEAVCQDRYFMRRQAMYQAPTSCTTEGWTLPISEVANYDPREHCRVYTQSLSSLCKYAD
jgi:hypothetical protein